jgi:hypothetical protein
MTTNSMKDQPATVQAADQLRGLVSSIAQATRHLEALTATIVAQELAQPVQDHPERLQLLRSLLLEEDPKLAELRAALEGRNTPPA